MSMVGYILGLGDRWDSVLKNPFFTKLLSSIQPKFSYSRHPSNLMLDRLSGKILHIDFGDCFEVRADIFSVNSTHCEHKSIGEWTLLWPLTGCHDQREVPWKDSFQTDKDADQCHGGTLFRMVNVSKAEAFFNLFSMSVFSIRNSKLWVWGLWPFIFKYKDKNVVCWSKLVYICEPPLWLAARWQA